jgi:hypothetical protein
MDPCAVSYYYYAKNYIDYYCVPCLIDNCEECVNKTLCSKCAPTYFPNLRGNTSTWNISTPGCTNVTVNATSFMNGSCASCGKTFAHCLTCTANGCLTCEPGFYANFCGICVSATGNCSLGCINCNATGCTVCAPAYTLTNNSCVAKCSDPKPTYNSSSGGCDCREGYYLNWDTCTACRDSYCIECSYAACLKCAPRYYQFRDACYPCMPDCQECRTRRICDKCDPGFGYFES